MKRTASIIHFLLLLIFVNGCRLGDNCKLINRKDGVVTVDKDCSFFTSLSGPEMVDHSFCGIADPFKAEILVCCPISNNIQTRLMLEITVEGMCQSFQVTNMRGVGGTRIVGGSKSFVGEFPHFASLGYKQQSSESVDFFCGGALISDSFVLTAAHCCRKSQMPHLVRLGKVNKTSFDLIFIILILEIFLRRHLILRTRRIQVFLLIIALR